MIESKKKEIAYLTLLLLKTNYKACAILTLLMYKEHKIEVNNLYLQFARIIRINEFTHAEQAIAQDKRPELLNEICIQKPDDYADDYITPPTAMELTVQQKIRELLIQPQKNYVNAITELKHDLELQKLARLHLSEQKAEDVTMIIDAEQSVDHATLNKIIDDKVSSQVTKVLKKMKPEKKKKQQTDSATASNNNNNNNTNRSNNNNTSNQNNNTSSTTTNNRRNNTGTNNRNNRNDKKTNSNTNSTSKNNNRGATSASSKKKTNNSQDDRNNASPKLNRDDSTDSSKRRRKTGNNNNNN